MRFSSRLMVLFDTQSMPDLYAAMELFPHSVIEAEEMATQVLADAALLKSELLAVSADERTYANTVLAYDRFDQLLTLANGILTAFEYLSSEVERRSEPINRFRSQALFLSSDRAFFRAFQEYEDTQFAGELLNQEQVYYFTKLKHMFLSQGYGLSAEAFAAATHLAEQEAALAAKFETLINSDHSFVVCSQEALTGLEEQFIAAQERDENGMVKLYCNHPTYFAVMDYCSNPEVRATFFEAYYRRAYPENVAVLETLIAVRDKQAKVLGFESYAAFRLESLLIKKPEHASAFLHSIEETVRAAAARDIAAASGTIPSDIIRDAQGALVQSDLPYVFAAHQKIRYALDKRTIAEYFPVQKTIEGIFAIYEKFMSIEFEYAQEVPGGWHGTLQGITVYTKGRTQILGFIILDLYPRPYKYSHACCFDIFSRVTQHPELPAVSLVIANFPEAQGAAPALLTHGDVTTFFHEFGHAIHNILGVTQHYGTRAFSVPTDFVELPSQILEEWMWDRDMLRLVSSHYATGEPLPDSLIDMMLAAREFGQGYQELRQLLYARYSLECFEAGEYKDSTKLFLELAQKYSVGVAINQRTRMNASFGHLASYGPMYYGYALARAYAADVFAVIKKHGLLNSDIGQRFVEAILAPGASKDADQLLIDFLGKPATADAYRARLASLSS
jgi:thimet oligopeptidase